MSVLKRDMRDSNRRAYAVSSRKNLKIQWESFLLFCTYFRLGFLPVSTLTLQLYAQFLGRTFKSTESIRNYISGIRILHLLMGFNIDQINTFLVNLTIKGISKLKLHMVKRAEPITPDILRQIFLVMNVSNKDDTTFWCLFLFAFFLMARKSNLVPTSSKDLLNPKFLLRKDIEFSGKDLIVSMRWTKTIQSGERVLRTPLTAIPDCCLCPVSAFKHMIKQVPAKELSPLFILSSGKPVSYSMFLSKLRSVIVDIGLEPSQFSTHSFRRGLATLAFRLDIPGNLIQLMGDWRSDAYKNYIQYSLQDKFKVSRFIGNNITNDDSSM